MTSRSFLLNYPPFEAPFYCFTGLPFLTSSLGASWLEAFTYPCLNFAAPSSPFNAFKTPTKFISSFDKVLVKILSYLSLRSLSSWVDKFFLIKATLDS